MRLDFENHCFLEVDLLEEYFHYHQLQGIRHYLDYHHYLPIFFEGIREKMDPYRFLAV